MKPKRAEQYSNHDEKYITLLTYQDSTIDPITALNYVKKEKLANIKVGSIFTITSETTIKET
jgi:hypothetical protein